MLFNRGVGAHVTMGQLTLLNFANTRKQREKPKSCNSHLSLVGKIVPKSNLQSLKFLKLRHILDQRTTSLAGQVLVPFLGLVMFFQLKTETAFRLKIHLSFKTVKHCHHPPLLWCTLQFNEEALLRKKNNCGYFMTGPYSIVKDSNADLTVEN